MYKFGFYRTWDAKVVYLKSIDHLSQTITYVDFEDKEHTMPESQFFGDVKMLVGDIRFGHPADDQYIKYPFARKIEGFNFVRYSANNDIVSLKLSSK